MAQIRSLKSVFILDLECYPILAASGAPDYGVKGRGGAQLGLTAAEIWQVRRKRAKTGGQAAPGGTSAMLDGALHVALAT